MADMIAFFVVLAVLMVLVVAAGTWSAGSRQRVVYARHRSVPQGRVMVEEEVVYDDSSSLSPSASGFRRIVRRRRTI